jgi:uncharacterized SAM-binding protein YcdF (DUF218 family)
VSQLERVPNVRLLGAKTHAELPDYIKAFDVGIVPYRLSDYTANVYPTKLNEYLVMGLPVVATPLHEIERFNRNNGNIISVAGDPAAFADATRAALARPRSEGCRERIDAAQRNSWETRIDQMWAKVESGLRARRAASRTGEDRLRRLYRVGGWRTVEVAAMLLVVYLALFYSPLLWWVASPLRIEAPPTRADAAVVFAGGVGESGQAGGGYQERVKQAVDLFRAGQVPALLFSSGYVFAFREADVMRALAVDSGVPPSAISLEEAAANTYQNVTNTAQIARSRRWHRILLVSSPYHMKRALLTWRKMAPDIEVVPAPPPASQFYTHGYGASLEQIRGIVHEYAAILVYRWRGWI